MAFALHFLAFPCKSRNPLLSTHSSSSTQSNLPTFRSLSFSTSLTRNVLIKGCLPTSSIERPTSRQSVVRMARRYAPNSRLRKMKSRKRGGDPEKKRSRKRKRTGRRKGRGETKKKKKNVKIIRLVSSAGTGFSYTKKTNTKTKEKLEIQKYDPNIRSRVKFTEIK